ncbi:MAG TPA: acyltransferase [Terracidiphilus sp.]|nr:acyltransferase [Terracidiphilus sp.]
MADTVAISQENAGTVPAPVARPRLHLPYVDGFRALAALYVVECHAWVQSWPANDWNRAVSGWLVPGDYAVIFFIVISGFCLTLPVAGRDGTLGPGGAPRFFFRRARRILPPYYAALALSIVIGLWLVATPTHRQFDISWPINPSGVLSHIFLVHNLSTRTISQVSVPLWSIAVECQIYLLFPLLLWMRRSLGMTAMLGITYIGAMTLNSLIGNTSFMGLAPMYVFYFALGMLAAEAALGPPRRAYLWLFAVCAALALCAGFRPMVYQFTITEVVYGLLGASALIVCAHRPRNPLARLAGSRPLARIGLFSYSLYLIHFPLLYLVWQHAVLPLHLGPTATYALMATAGVALILLFSYAFYLVFERPFLSQSAKASALQPAGSLAQQ